MTGLTVQLKGQTLFLNLVSDIKKNDFNEKKWFG